MKKLILVFMASLLMLGAAAQGRFAAFELSRPLPGSRSAMPLKRARLGLVPPPVWFRASSPSPLAADHYARQMAWTCRQEWRLEKATRVPLRLRLGSVEQTNFLEGKLR